MKTINFVLTGLGGQGILFMTKVLATTALNSGYNILGAETHGMAQRGGSVVSHLESRAMEAARTAMELGGPRSTNLAMIAFFAAFECGPLSAVL